MKRPTPASRKKVTPENLARLGADRLAGILFSVAATRPELKRRLRMELAAEEGAEHLGPEIDKRLAALETSRSKVTWRQRGAFLRDLEGLRGLVASQLAALDRPGAVARLWIFLRAGRRVRGRVQDRDGELGAIFLRAAQDLAGLLRDEDIGLAAAALAEGLYGDPAGWADWLPPLLASGPPGLAEAALRVVSLRDALPVGGAEAVRRLADAAGNADAFIATFTPAALKTRAVAAEAALRLLKTGRVAEAGDRLSAAAPQPGLRGSQLSARTDDPDFQWEGAWIAFLDHTDQADAAQAARWASFERTLSPARLKAYMGKLGGFDDVDAEHRALQVAAAAPDATRALRFLIEWRALSDAARLIETRGDELAVEPQDAEAWAARLAPRHPAAAEQLLRRAAAAAFRRRELATASRLTAEADALQT